MIDPEEQSPIEILIETAERVADIDERTLRDAKYPRTYRVEITEFRARRLMAIDMGAQTSSEIKEAINNEKLRGLTKLYDTFLINYTMHNGERKYSLTPVGRQALADFREQEELNLEDIADGEDTDEHTPWINTELSKGTYIALQLIDEFDGHPRTRDIDEDFIAHGFNSENDSIVVAPRISQLYHDHGYVDRPAEEPYRYWLTESGKQALADATDE
jgi:hypothetical protein